MSTLNMMQVGRMADAVEDCVLGEDVSTDYGLRIAALFAIMTASFIGGVLPLITRHAKTGDSPSLPIARIRQLDQDHWFNRLPSRYEM